jgi:hypothetical protein
MKEETIIGQIERQTNICMKEKTIIGQIERQMNRCMKEETIKGQIERQTGKGTNRLTDIWTNKWKCETMDRRTDRQVCTQFVRGCCRKS